MSNKLKIDLHYLGSVFVVNFLTSGWSAKSYVIQNDVNDTIFSYKMDFQNGLSIKTQFTYFFFSGREQITSTPASDQVFHSH